MRPIISKYAHVAPGAKIGPGSIIGPGVTIADDVIIGPYCVIGGRPEHRSFFNGEPTAGTMIEAGARIFEFVTIHSGTTRATSIGRGTAIFNRTHIGHDCIIEDGAIIGGQCSLAGHVHVMTKANISGKSCVVQKAVIGAYGFLGGMSYLTKHIPPGQKWLGFPGSYARFVDMNFVGLERANLSICECTDHYKDTFEALIKGVDL